MEVPRAVHHLAWFLSLLCFPSLSLPPSKLGSVITTSICKLLSASWGAQPLCMAGVGDGGAAWLHLPRGWSGGGQAARAARVRMQPAGLNLAPAAKSLAGPSWPWLWPDDFWQPLRTASTAARGAACATRASFEGVRPFPGLRQSPASASLGTGPGDLPRSQPAQMCPWSCVWGQ